MSLIEEKQREVRIADEHSCAAEEAERKRKEAEIARQRGDEEHVYEVVKNSPTISLCQYYLAQWPDGRYCRQVSKVLEKLNNKRMEHFSRAQRGAFAVIALVIVLLMVAKAIQQNGGMSLGPTRAKSAEISK